MFCPDCGSILKIKKEGSKNVKFCSCGYKGTDAAKSIFSETVKKKHEDIPIIDKDYETLPLTEAECKKCGHRKAHFWLVQTRASDEPETKFLKCEKCKHTWRDYD